MPANFHDEVIPCPFVYAGGRACKGHVVDAWQKWRNGRDGLFVHWIWREGKWVDLEDNSDVFDANGFVFPGWHAVSHIHLVCSSKNNHSGIKPDDPRVKTWSLPQPKAITKDVHSEQSTA